MADERYFLDVNIPMYAAGAEHPLKAPCIAVLQKAVDGEIELLIDAEIIQEVLHRYGSVQRWRLAEEVSQTLLTLASRVLPVGEAEMVQTLALFKQYAPLGIRARDLLHVAVMQANELTQIISTDSHFDSITGITRLSPTAFTNTFAK